MKPRSPQREAHRRQQRADDERADQEAEQDGEQEPAPPEPLVRDQREVDGQPERDERRQLAEVGERGVEARHVVARPEPDVAHHDARDEDGEEARAVRDRRGAVDDARREDHRDRVERAIGEDRGAEDGTRATSAPATPIASPTLISTTNSLTTVENEPSLRRRDLDHPDHQRDADRVVEARLPLEDRAGAPADLLPGQDRERDGRIGGRERRAEQPGRRSRRGRGRRGRPPRSARRCRTCRATPSATIGTADAAEAREADLRAALEQDHDQRERRDPLDVLEGEDRREPVGRGREAAAATTRSAPAVGIASRPATARTPSASRARRRRRGSARRSRGGRPWGDLARRLAAPRRGSPSGPRLTLSLRPSHPQPTRRTDTAGTHAPRASHCGRARPRRPRRVGCVRALPARSRSRTARGTVVLKGKGIVIGRLERGEVEIVDLSPLDQWSPRVNGVPRGRTVWTRGKNINFYVPGGRYLITVRGEGFSVSARGQGTATLDRPPRRRGLDRHVRRRRRHARAAPGRPGARRLRAVGGRRPGGRREGGHAVTLSRSPCSSSRTSSRSRRSSRST